MELILFAAAAAFVVGASVIGLHNSVSNQSSKSSVSEALDNIQKTKEEIDKKIKTQLLLGTVTIIAKIANWQAGRDKAQKETINEIASASGAATAAITANVINIGQNVIESLEDGVSGIMTTPDVEPSIPPFIPQVIPDDGPISSPLNPPNIPNDGPIPNPLTPPEVASPGTPPLNTPDQHPHGIPPLIPPVEKPKELGGNILWMGNEPQYKSTTYGHKHSAPKNVKWDDVVKSTKNGPAKYKYGTNIEELEMEALENGIDASNGKPWKVYDTGRIIGSKDGKETPYIRVEISPDGTVHSHPITPNEYKKLSK